MIRKILPAVLALLAFLGGAAAGDILRAGDDGASAASAPDASGEKTADPAKAESDHAASGENDHAASGESDHAAPAAKENAHPPAAASGSGEHGGTADPAATTWFKFPQQFFVPVLHDGQLDSTMILSLSVEMPGAASETVYAHEIKLRDALLRRLLIHANTGGFDGNFTAEAQLRKLRAELVSTAQEIVPAISDILIGDIARQER